MHVSLPVLDRYYIDVSRPCLHMGYESVVTRASALRAYKEVALGE